MALTYEHIEAAPSPFKGQFRKAVADVTYTARGNNYSSEGWTTIPRFTNKWLRFHVILFAEQLGCHADEETNVLATHYAVDQYSPEHQDQLIAGKTLDKSRTISVIYLIQRAKEGGEVTLQDPGRLQPKVTVDLKPNEMLVFPADYWHSVLPVKKGIRRSIVRWYHDSSPGASFSSS